MPCFYIVQRILILFIIYYDYLVSNFYWSPFFFTDWLIIKSRQLKQLKILKGFCQFLSFIVFFFFCLLFSSYPNLKKKFSQTLYFVFLLILLYRQQNLEYADSFPCRVTLPPPKKKGWIRYDTTLFLMLSRRVLGSWESSFHCFYSQVHSDPA